MRCMNILIMTIAMVQKFEVIFEKLLRHLNLVLKSFLIITAVTSTL